MLKNPKSVEDHQRAGISPPVGIRLVEPTAYARQALTIRLNSSEG